MAASNCSLLCGLTAAGLTTSILYYTVYFLYLLYLPPKVVVVVVVVGKWPITSSSMAAAYGRKRTGL